MKKSQKSRFRRLQYEALESREVMAASIMASLSATGVLTVTGTDAADQINFRQISNSISISGVGGTWTAAAVKSIVVDLKGGNDVVSFQSTANGGNQAIAETITVKSGAGQERVRLATGVDVNFTGAGNTLEVASNNVAKLNGVTLNLTSTVQTVLQSGVLTVTATNGNDNLQFVRTANRISLKGLAGSWAVADVKSIVVYLQERQRFCVAR